MRYNSLLCACQLLAMKMWMHPHSSKRIKEMNPHMASMARIPSREGFSWEEMLISRPRRKKKPPKLTVWETKSSLVAKTKLNLKRNKVTTLLKQLIHRRRWKLLKKKARKLRSWKKPRRKNKTLFPAKLTCHGNFPAFLYQRRANPAMFHQENFWSWDGICSHCLG